MEWEQAILAKDLKFCFLKLSQTPIAAFNFARNLYLII